MRQRAYRLAEAIKEEISDIIKKDMKDPRIGFVSVVKVEVSNDLRHARVYFSVLGSKQEREACLKGLESARGYIRSELGQRIRLYYTPELTFSPDDSIEHGARIAKILSDLRAQETPAAGPGKPTEGNPEQ